MNAVFAQWLPTFALTIAVELVVAWPVLGLVERGRWRRIGWILLANVLTHPIVFTLASIPRTATVLFPLVVVLELGASIVEALLYRHALARHAFPVAMAASFLANAASLAASVVLWHA